MSPGRRGRPSLDPNHPSMTLNVRLPAPLYDRLYTAARLHNETVPEYARIAMKQRIIRDLKQINEPE